MIRRAPRLLAFLVVLVGELVYAHASCAQVNHFLCYQRPRRATRIDLGLDDALGTGDVVRVTESKRLCLPADHEDQDPTAPNDREHLAGYRIKQVSPHFLPHKDWVVRDEFGVHVLSVVKPEQMLVPAALSLAGLPALLTPTLDYFKCFRTAYSKYRTFGVKIDDHFGTVIVDIKKPLRLCVPADKDGEGIRDPVHALMCYTVNLAKGSVRPVLPDPVFTRDALGETMSSAPVRPRELCVPAELGS